MVPINSKNFHFPMPIRDRVIPPPFISEELLGEYAKKGKKIKKRKGSKSKASKASKASQQQKVSQKINIKIGDLSRFKEEDTAMLHKQEKASQYPVYPTSSQTSVRLEAPYFKYSEPLPATVPNLFQAQPSSVIQPIVPSQPVIVKAQDLQPKKNNPIVQDTDPNDLQRSLKSHVVSGYSTPSPYYISPAMSGYSTPASRQEEYIANRLFGDPGRTFINVRQLDEPRASQASSSIIDANNESLRLQRLQKELFDPQRDAQRLARNFFMDKQPIQQLQSQLQPSQAQRIEPRSISSKEAGYNPIPNIKDIAPLLNKVVQRTLKKGSFSV
jgi:hypothetical protein